MWSKFSLLSCLCLPAGSPSAGAMDCDHLARPSFLEKGRQERSSLGKLGEQWPVRLVLTSRTNMALVQAGPTAMHEPTAFGDGAPREAERGGWVPAWCPARLEPSPVAHTGRGNAVKDTVSFALTKQFCSRRWVQRAGRISASDSGQTSQPSNDAAGQWWSRWACSKAIPGSLCRWARAFVCAFIHHTTSIHIHMHL